MSAVPGEDYKFCADDFWLIAFADDLVLLASSREKANEILAKLTNILAEFDLEFSAVKSEGMVFTPGGRCSSFDTLSTDISLGAEALKLVGAFKYLGTWLEPSLKPGKHLAVVEERARLATLETTKLVRQLNITESHRYGLLYRSLVESQLYGTELFPASGAPVINRVRRGFLNALFELPADMSSTIANFFMRLLPAELLIVKCRRNFLERLGKHDIPLIKQVLLLERHLGRRNVGWCHENFIVSRHIHPALRSQAFDFPVFAEQLFSRFPDLDRINFAVILNRAREDASLSFFCHLTSFKQAVCLRKALGTLSFEHARIVMLFLFSGLRWRISRMPLKTCPFCPRFDLIWSHFFECEFVLPYLLADFLSLDLLLRYVRVGKWRDVFTIVGDVIRVWCDHLSTCSLDLDVVFSLANLP